MSNLQEKVALAMHQSCYAGGDVRQSHRIMAQAAIDTIYEALLSDEVITQGTKSVSDFFAQGGIFCYNCLPSEAIEEEIAKAVLTAAVARIRGGR